MYVKYYTSHLWISKSRAARYSYLDLEAQTTTSFWSKAQELADSSISSVLEHRYNTTALQVAHAQKKYIPRQSHNLQSPAARSYHVETGPSPVQSVA